MIVSDVKPLPCMLSGLCWGSAAGVVSLFIYTTGFQMRTVYARLGHICICMSVYVCACDRY